MSYDIIRLLPDILIENAIKFTQKSGKIECVFEYDSTNNLIITVENTCQYVDDERIQTILKSWSREENSRFNITSDLGVGLIILKRIVEAHEGEVEIESTYTHQSDGVKFGQFKIRVILPELSECDYDDD